MVASVTFLFEFNRSVEHLIISACSSIQHVDSIRQIGIESLRVILSQARLAHTIRVVASRDLRMISLFAYLLRKFTWCWDTVRL